MGKKLKFMLLTLLGFSAACSTVRNGAGNDSDGKTLPEAAEEAPEVQVDTIRTIRVLYGVRRPQLLPENGNRGREEKGSAAGTASEESR